MVRAPCCEKMGLKKGPWTPEEDKILVAFIQRYGHGNWRALPKQAGLLRCGKSCRLRWTNYLRPDIKRGNFSKEEEETIIKLHEMLGNRWSAIAARLPGRTDNEIKNVWHTHLKKRLIKKNPSTEKAKTADDHQCKSYAETEQKQEDYSLANHHNYIAVSPQRSSASSDLSTSSGTEDCSGSAVEVNGNNNLSRVNSSSLVDISSGFEEDFFSPIISDPQFQLAFSSSSSFEEPAAFPPGYNSPCTGDDDSLDFWMNVYMEAGSLPELLDLQAA
ncbi:hypothetical protein ACLOJK_009619 [Asimina triloba]